MPVTESQRKAQVKYLSNPENRKKKNEWNAEYRKTYKYQPTEEQKEQYKLASLVKKRTHEEKIKICEELLKYEEIQKFLAKIKEKNETAETDKKYETDDSKN